MQAAAPVMVNVKLPTGIVYIKVWVINVGRVKLYLLDTNIPENPQRRASRHHRFALWRRHPYAHPAGNRARHRRTAGAASALNLEPTVFHMNEGHSAFLAMERIRLLMAEHGLTFDEALEASRLNNVFTTHTSVPAGIDIFDAGMMYDYFHEYCASVGHRLRSVARARDGRTLHDQAERFSMAILAFKTLRASERRQPAAPSRLAGDVAGPLARAAGGRGADHFGHQRRAPADLAEWRFRDSLRSVPAAGLARTVPRCRDLGPDPGHSGPGTLGSAPPPQAPADRIRSRADGEVRRRPQGRRSRNSPSRRSARSRTRSPSASRAGSPHTSAPHYCSATWIV